MAEVEYLFPYQNSNAGLIISANQLLADMFYGIRICTPTGDVITNKTIEGFITSAQETLERKLNLKFLKTVIDEQKDFYSNDWASWGFIQTTYPVRKAFLLDGFINTVRQIQYPEQWLSVRKTSDGKLFRRSIHLVPNQGGVTNQNSVVYNGVTPHLGFMNLGSIPNYWRMIYTTGFDIIPEDIIKAVEMLASIPLYMLMGNGILGVAGLNSQSISIDGLSQSKSIEAGGFTTKIKQLNFELFGQDGKGGLIGSLKDYYYGIELSVA